MVLVSVLVVYVNNTELKTNRWDAEFATKAYKDEVEALAQRQLLEDLEYEVREAEEAAEGNFESARLLALLISLGVNLPIQVVGTLFKHHQKCIVVDTQASGNNRKITAFIGGLDLCDGHYDTPEHRLFRDLDSVFANDFHNPTFPVRGPRQPWHDLHCRIDGPVAHDILTNFEQRWRKATKWKDIGIKKVTRWYDDALINLYRMSWILTPAASNDENVRVSKEGDPENWHVQVFRSIDSGSVKEFPKVVKEAEKQNLMCGKNLKIDRSIHAAYVKAIRSLQGGF
ncbi:hypothetical protein IFM89_000940 [Coptis chinensis]|uniref:phospholipase D n=1 Tax=Coptis chinensis TaxID=261450 RepID=A0A835IG43_9MAGN|nr:hypothetical protein IFM89_000940 [Coptis chinensis]